jgi:hypothetical protein
MTQLALDTSQSGEETGASTTPIRTLDILHGQRLCSDTPTDEALTTTSVSAFISVQLWPRENACLNILNM